MAEIGQREDATARTSLEMADRAPLSGKMEDLEVMANSGSGVITILEVMEIQVALLEAEVEAMVQEVPAGEMILKGEALEVEAAAAALRLTISLGSSEL